MYHRFKNLFHRQDTVHDNQLSTVSIVGVNPSAILGTQMKGSLTVKAGGDYAGGSWAKDRAR